MIVTELYSGQGLGNQLWTYVVARILADKNHCDFAILGQDKFKGSQFMDLDFGVTLRGGQSPEGGPPQRLPDGILHYYRERKENYLVTTADITRTDPGLLSIKPFTKFDGNCQSTKYLQGYRQQILTWLAVKAKYRKPEANDTTCVIHMRCGDFTNLKDIFLPAAYYRQAMELMEREVPSMKFICVTDQAEIAKKILPEIEIVGSAKEKTIDRYKAAHHQGGSVAIDFALLMNAPYLIIPNSSFSWWAAYLNANKKKVIAPKFWAEYNNSDGYWSTSDIITDDFTYLDRQGRTWTADQCWREKEQYESKHPDIFTKPVVTPPSPPSLVGRVRSFGGRVITRLLPRQQ